MTFLEEGVKEPEDPKMRYCHLCKYQGTVDVPADNALKIIQIILRIREHKAAKATWVEAKKGGGDVAHVDKRGRTYTHSPRISPIERIPFV